MGNSLLKDIQYSNIIFDSAPIGMAIGTFDGILLKVNEAFCETIGYKEEEILGKKFSIFTHQDDLKINLAQNKRIVSGEIKKHRLVKRYIHKNGKIIHAIMTVTGLVNNKGVLSYLLAQIVDITDRKEIEEAYRKSDKEFRDIFENAPISIAKVGLDGRILNVNKAFLKSFKYSKKELSGLLLSDISHPEDLKINIELDKKLLRGEIRDFTMEKRYLKKTGEIMHGLLKVTLIRGEDESYFLGQIVDITKIKHGEIELEDKNIQLSKINTELDNFVYRSSHDLKGPISSLKGLFLLAEKENLNVPFKEKMSHSIYKLENVINDIANFSQNTHLDVQYENVNIKQLLNTVVRDQQNNYLDQETRIDINFEMKKPAVTDPKRLSVVLKNLISNSLQFRDTAKEDPFVEINISSDSRNIILRIKDNGKGISEDQRPRIFNMFYRGDENSTGSGLGLYIVKEIIDKLDGEISLDSTLGKGTRVDVEIPNHTHMLVEEES